MLDRVINSTLIGATACSGIALVFTPFYCLMPMANLWAGFLVFVMSFLILVGCFAAYFAMREYQKYNQNQS